MRMLLRLFPATFLTLTACKTEVVADIYFGDVLDVAAGRSTEITTPARLSVELSSTDDCDRPTKALLALLGDYFVSPEVYACETADGRTNLTLQVLLPIYQKPEQWGADENMVLGIYPQPSEGRVQVDVLYHADAMAQLNLLLAAEFGAIMTFDDPQIIIMLHNDRGSLGIAQLSGSIIEGEPAIQFRRFLVPKTSPVEVIIGSVKVAYMKQYGFVPVVQILTFEDNGPPVEQEG